MELITGSYDCPVCGKHGVFCQRPAETDKIILQELYSWGKIQTLYKETNLFVKFECGHEVEVEKEMFYSNNKTIMFFKDTLNEYNGFLTEKNIY